MIRDEAPSKDRVLSFAPLIEQSTPHSQFHRAQDDAPIEPVSDLDIEESLRLLDEIWPRDSSFEEQFPRPFGRFTILGELGRGGFGVVYLAEDPLLGRKVALKLPRVEVLSGTEGWRRFLREARAASRLDHPNLIPLLDAGAIGPVGYIVSAFVPGPSLEQWLRHNRGACSPRCGARLVRALASAIEHAHQNDVLHRDLKPANVLLHAPECNEDMPGHRTWESGRVESWTPRICDFGLAKLREIGTDNTKSRIGCGSPPYMAPEQAEARANDIGPATDVYGLGAILYELLTGRPPFCGESDLETLRKVVADEPDPPRKRRPELPRDLETICLACLSKPPGSRYRSAAALAAELERYLDGRPIERRPLPFWARGWRWACRKPAWAAVAMATLLAVVAGLFGLLQYQATLRQHNKDLQIAIGRAEQSESEATAKRDEAERSAKFVRRQLIDHQIFSAQFAVMAKNFDLANRRLDEAGVELGTSDHAGFAWSYLRQLVTDRLEILVGHNHPVECLAVTADGRTLASADSGVEVWLWDLANGRRRRLETPNQDCIRHLAFSPDGRRLASSVEKIAGIDLWDVPSGRLLGRLVDRSITLPFCTTLYNGDGDRCIAVRNPDSPTGLSITCWNVTRPVDPFTPAKDENSAKIARELEDKRLQDLADLLDDSLSSSISAVKLSDFKGFLRTRALRGVAVTGDRVMALVAPGDGTFTLYHTPSALRLAVGRCDGEGITIVLSYTEGDKRCTPQDRQRLERWVADLIPRSTESPKESHRVVRLGKGGRANFNPARQELAIWNEDQDRLNIIDTRTGDKLLTYDLGEINDVVAMCYTPDGETLALGGLDHKIRLWHPRPTALRPTILRGHSPAEAWSVAFSPDGQTLATSGDDGVIRLWNVKTGVPTGRLRDQNALVTSIKFSPDGRRLASGGYDPEKPLILWDLTTKLPECRLEGHAGPVRALAFSPDSRTLVSGGNDYTIMIWDTLTGMRTHTIPQRPNTCWCLAFSPDRRTVAAGTGPDRIVLIDSATGQIRSIPSDAEVGSLTFSPDGSRLTSGHKDGSIRIWDVAEERHVQTYSSGHSNRVLGLSLSPDGRSLASAGEDKTVRVWDTLTGQELLCLTDCKARVNAVAFSPDGSILAAADHSGAITIWRARPQN